MKPCSKRIRQAYDHTTRIRPPKPHVKEHPTMEAAKYARRRSSPEVAAQIVARRTAGEPTSDIGDDLHLTPFAVSGVLRAAAQAKKVRS